MSVETRESSSSAGASTDRPQYSIVVPAYNESARLGSTLRQILDHFHEQRWDVEILVVDDGSRDNTAELIRSYAAAHPEVRLVQNPGNQGKGYAVRNGMLQAR
ncbi:MAG TPA: glycosyltransferase, partial [Candidatus Angelobacter sp.]|nr:glycosyltransferase [Candidatus Angelobacter sp.]